MLLKPFIMLSAHYVILSLSVLSNAGCHLSIWDCDFFSPEYSKWLFVAHRAELWTSFMKCFYIHFLLSMYVGLGCGHCNLPALLLLCLFFKIETFFFITLFWLHEYTKITK